MFLKELNMLGAIVGDIVGSPYEYCNTKRKDFPLFSSQSCVTDDTILTLAVCKALLSGSDNLEAAAARFLRTFAWRYADKDYGDRFIVWMSRDDACAYGSFGNGAAMRVSPCSIAAKSLEEVKSMSYAVTAPTHNHPEGLKGAEATAVAGFLAANGENRSQIERYIDAHYYPMDFSLDSIRDSYSYAVSCQATVPVALKAFFESTSFEDAIRNAVSIGGDSDTIAAITGGIAGFYYGVDEPIAQLALGYLDNFQKEVLERFETAFLRERSIKCLKKAPD